MFPYFRGSSKKPNRQQPKKPLVAKRRLRLESLEAREMLTTFTVANLNDSGTGSLRQAILNANATSGASTIDFSVLGTINLTSAALPAIDENVDIAGSSAPGFSAAPVVEVDFNLFNGLDFISGSGGSTVDGLSLVDAAGSPGVTISNTNNVTVEGNYIGLDLNGSTVNANVGDGVNVTDSTAITIGGTSAADRNVIAGNNGNGVTLDATSDSVVEGNYIGTDSTGTTARANQGNGVLVETTATDNTIGGTTGNVISGNSANGVLINSGSSGNTLSGNTIGLSVGGTAPLGNTLDGVEVLDANNNVIGNTNPVSSTTYNATATVNLNTGGTAAVTAWQGLRGGDTSGQYIMSGTSGNNGLLFEGTLAGVGTGYYVNYPTAQTSSVYGPNNQGGGNLQLVGSYKYSNFLTAPITVNGFIFQGTTADLSNAADYTTIDHPGSAYNYIHSTMGGLAVGNYDLASEHGEGNLPLGPANAYIYDIASQSFIPISYPGSQSNTAYGIWYNGGTSYTIVGGYSNGLANNFADQDQPIGTAYIVDYDSSTGQFSNWTSVSDPAGSNYYTHFEGISSTASGTYTISADSNQNGTGPLEGALVTIVRNADGSFGTPTWSNLTYTGSGQVSGQDTSANSVWGNALLGIVTGGGGSTFSYTANVNTAFQLSNVISANGLNGIELNDSSDNDVAMNYVGTNATGTVAFGNSQNGILVTDGSASNLIGGEATGGNDPTNDVYIRPPQGNLISGNALAGVLINAGSTLNQLSGNYIGTTASGSTALGNGQDGVKISGANDNSLIGCNFEQDPFVFYNVISGNGGNGLYVLNSNGTTIQANFFGVGANNTTALGNTLNGVLIAGSSSQTTMGGPIPLGNVDAANGQNGIVVQDTASYFTSYNTFCGLAAFTDQLNLGNGRDGMLITTTGAGILIRTNIINENDNDGIEIGGAATGVQISGNLIGLASDQVSMGNKHDGIEIDGTAHNNVIGGPQPTFNVIAQNTISANADDGVAIDGSAYDNTVNNSFIGTDLLGTAARGNGMSGVYIGPGSNGNIIGSNSPTLLTVISANGGNGIEMNGNSGNIVVGTYIGTDDTGANALGNAGNGIYIGSGTNDVVGSRNTTIPQNIIAFNGANGVNLYSGSGDGIHTNSIYSNNQAGIFLTDGANLNQAAPVLTSVHTVSTGTQVTGSVNSTADTTFTLEFFANTTTGASGRYLLGSTLVTTNSLGIGTFIFSGSKLPSGASYVTATATDPENNTSAFSAAVAKS
ncbi:MAG TPA: right-handed parallel beta-helix repeat-containing protein [Pirellulales bacterium]|jgi:hypothetical protein|nr:right-handed parallel beta-helix repeat-containing protein [Pirellulales bacterium]